MSVVAGPLFAAAALLAAAGAAKVLRPAATVDALRTAALPGTASMPAAPARLWLGRLLGLVELVVACVAVAVGGRLAGLLIGGVYLGFAMFTARLLHIAGAGASCGCFGAEQSPAAPVHVVVNAGIAATAATAVAWPTPGLATVIGGQPLGGVPFVALCGVLAWLLFAVLTAVPALQAAIADPAEDRPTRTRRAVRPAAQR